MPLLKKRIQFWAAGAAGSAAVGVLRRAWRIRLHEPAGLFQSVRHRGHRVMVAFWHRHLLTLLAAYRGLPFCVPVSEHRDGEYISWIMERCGFLAVRGSSTRGAIKLLRNLTAVSKQGWNVAVTPDGPRGPRYSVKPGFVMLARRAGLPVYPVGVAVSRAWEFNSWDRFLIPKPGARISVFVGDVIGPDRIESEEPSALCGALKQRLEEANERAARELERW
jgi:hypothetical protein